MNFNCVVANADNSGECWNETYDKPKISTLEQARKWAELTIKTFNSSLRPGEKPRKLIDVLPTKAKADYSLHSWEKTNLVTQVKRGLFFDTMRCKVCQITGKRYGLGTGIARDRQYRATSYESCAKSIELLKRKARG